MSFRIHGKVRGGNKLGRELGFPTANIAVEESLEVANGVYAAYVTVDGVVYKAMANLGHKPSVSADGMRTLEVNIFDFDKDIYGLGIEVEMLNFIRNEYKFDSLEELKQQIAKDKKTILEIIK